MRTYRVVCWAVAAVWALSLNVRSEADVVAVLGSGTTPILDSGGDGDPLDIDLGTFNEDVTIRIYDEATDGETPPGLSVGTITISGTPEDGARVYVLVANRIVEEFPDSAFAHLEIAPGIVNLGNSGGGIVFGSTALRDASVIAIAATGDLTGSIDCGKVFRIPAGGTIASNITAYGVNDTGTNPTLGQFAINVITAGDGITGDIIAAGDGEFDPELPATWATIGRVIVGVAEGPLGIRGDIKAEAGEIRSIFTAGLHTDGKARTLCIGATVQPRGVAALFAFLTCWFNSFNDPLCNPE